jgi:hypothetical protein
MWQSRNERRLASAELAAKIAKRFPEKSHTPGGGGAKVDRLQSFAHAEKTFRNGNAQLDYSSRRSADDATICQVQLIDYYYRR